MPRLLLSIFALLMCTAPCTARLHWGDQADGTYINPVLCADYSDPDVIRVGDKYYLTCSEFHFMGMPILESDDLVNWRIVAQVFNTLPGYDSPTRYAEGTWAPSLRYHDGTYYIYVCSPHDGLWLSTAPAPEGPWSEMRLIHEADKWEDPCPFWDEEGNAYLGRSQWGAGPIYVHRMSADGTEILDDGVVVYEGPVAEGTKFYAKDGWVYLSIPEGGVGTGWQTVLRSRSVYGPYEGQRVLEQGATDINGPHQGALVDTPDGREWWFVHFQETPVLGRVMHLQPVHWVDGFPTIGADFDGNGIGEPLRNGAKPSMYTGKPSLPQTDDEFDAETIGIQWQYNHNPDLSCFDLTSRPGWLTWEALAADSLRHACNTLTQKMMGYAGKVSAKLDFSGMAEGQRAGLISMGKYRHAAGVAIRDGVPTLYHENGGEIEYVSIIPESISQVELLYAYDAEQNTHRFFWLDPNGKPQPLGESFAQRWGDWKGVRIGLHNYTTKERGSAHFDNFMVDQYR